MNNFREWLSDNLRYILLGLVIILVLVGVFLGIRFLSSQFGTTNTEEESAKVTETPEATETPTPTAVADDFSANGNEKVAALISTYYTAIAAKDLNTLNTVVDTLSADDQSKIENDTILESYSDIEAYTKPGPQDGTYVVYAAYKYKIKNIATPVPGLSQLYVCTGESGDLYVQTEAADATTQTFIDSVSQETDVQALVSKVQKDYQTAVDGDKDLYNYMNPAADVAEETAEGMAEGDTNEAAAAQTEATPEPTAEPTPEPTATPEPTETPAPEPTVLTVASTGNLRAEPNMDCAVIGELTPGTQVTVMGEDSGYYLVDVNGQQGYIAKRFF